MDTPFQEHAVVSRDWQRRPARCRTEACAAHIGTVLSQFDEMMLITAAAHRLPGTRDSELVEQK